MKKIRLTETQMTSIIHKIILEEKSLYDDNNIIKRYNFEVLGDDNPLKWTKLYMTKNQKNDWVFNQEKDSIHSTFDSLSLKNIQIHSFLYRFVIGFTNHEYDYEWNSTGDETDIMLTLDKNKIIRVTKEKYIIESILNDVVKLKFKGEEEIFYNPNYTYDDSSDNMLYGYDDDY